MKKLVSMKAVFIVIVFLIFALLRFYNLEKRIPFDWDQEQFSTQVRQIIKDHKFTLIGPRVISDKGFFLASYFSYLLVPFYLITNTHPIALMPFLIMVNVLFFIAAYYVINKTFAFRHACWFLLFWSINYLLVGWEKVPWWPIFIPLGVIIVWKILANIYQNSSFIKWLTLGLTLGFFTNMHFQFVFLILFVLFFIILNLKKPFFINFQKATLLIGSFFLTFLPLLIFDLRHNFLNVNLLLNFIKKGGVNDVPWNPLSWFPVFNNSVRPMIYFESIFLTIIFYVLIAFFLIYLYKHKVGYKKSFYSTSTLLWLFFPIIFSLYGRRPSEYYFIFLYAFIYIVLIDFCLSINKKFILYVLIIIFTLISIKPTLKNFANDEYGLYYKDKITAELKKRTDGKKFNVAYITTFPNGNTGFKYLMNYYDIKQSGNWKDHLVQIALPCERCKIKYGGIGLIFHDNLE